MSNIDCDTYRGSPLGFGRCEDCGYPEDAHPVRCTQRTNQSFPSKTPPDTEIETMSDRAYTACGTRTVNTSATGATPREAGAALRRKGGVTPEWCEPTGNPDDGFDVIAVCEACADLIPESSTGHHCDGDGIYTCEPCAKDMPLLVMVLEEDGSTLTVGHRDFDLVLAEIEEAFRSGEGGDFKITFAEMARAEYDALPEFEGF